MYISTIYLCVVTKLMSICNVCPRAHTTGSLLSMWMYLSYKTHWCQFVVQISVFLNGKDSWTEEGAVCLLPKKCYVGEIQSNKSNHILIHCVFNIAKALIYLFLKCILLGIAKIKICSSQRFFHFLLVLSLWISIELFFLQYSGIKHLAPST